MINLCYPLFKVDFGKYLLKNYHIIEKLFKVLKS
jgi:hypothetical protein